MKTNVSGKWFATLLICISALGTAAVFGQGITFATNNYIVSGEPNSLVAADLFGRGKPDLISGNFGGLLTVLTNIGNGMFSSNITYNVGNGDRVLAADVNGDGKIDLVSVGSVTTVLTNNGHGVLTLCSTNNIGGSCAVAFSIGGSGAPDLVIGNSSGTIKVLTNNGSGHFGSNTTFNISGFVGALCAADINSDGQLDLVAVNSSSNSIIVFKNNGGEFGSNASYSVGSGPNSIAAADVNGDGLVDLITANSDNTLTVLTNDGTGAFAASPTVPSGRAPYGLVVADINGDRMADLIAIDNADGQGIVYVFTNSGAGTFGPFISVNGGHENQTLATADFNGDGKPDLVCGGVGSMITVLLNTTIFPSPPLNITSVGGQSLVYWTTPAPNSVLQATTNLNNPNWVNFTNGTPVIGVTVSNASPNMYFRLITQ